MKSGPVIGGNNPSPSPTRLTSDCICGEDDPVQNAIAYFVNKPAQYGGSYNSRLRLQSSRCLDLTACPVVGPDTKQIVLTGFQDVIVSQWHQYTSLINGRVTYSAEGQVVSLDGSENIAPEGSFVPVSHIVHDFSVSALAAALIDGNAAVVMSDKLLDCQAVCDPENPSPLCEIAPAPAGTGEPLKKLKARIGSAGKTSITATELLEMCGQATDDCKRKDTQIDSGHLVNTGEQCTIATKLPKLNIDVTIAVPPVVSGIIKVAGDRVAVMFPSKAEAGLLTLGDDDLNRRFGGRIHAVDADGQTLRFAMDHACLAISLP